MQNSDRRKFLRSVGIATGTVAIPGVAAAREPEKGRSSGDYPDSNIKIVDEVAVEPEDGKRYYSLKVKNTETGWIGEAVSGYNGDELDIHIAQGGATSKVKAEKQNGLVSAEGWDDLLFEELPNSAANTIDRAAAYRTDDDGSTCNGGSNYGEHQIAGFSIEHHEDISGVGESLLGLVIGAGTGALLTSWSGPGSVVGGAVGTIAGFVYSSLKDTEIYTVAYVDWDIGGFGWYTKGLYPHVHGTWKSDDVDDMFKASPSPYPLGHVDGVVNIV